MQISLWDLELYGSIIADLPALVGSELLNSWSQGAAPLTICHGARNALQVITQSVESEQGSDSQVEKKQHYIYIKCKIYQYFMLYKQFKILNVVRALMNQKDR